MYFIFKVEFVFVQAREAAALRETLHAEREAGSAELEALKVTVQKLESQKQEKPPPCPVISEKEVEERRRAEEKAAQDILQLTQVGLLNKYFLHIVSYLVLVVVFSLHVKNTNCLFPDHVLQS